MTLLDRFAYRLRTRYFGGRREVTPAVYYAAQVQCLEGGVSGAMRGPYWLAAVSWCVGDVCWWLRDKAAGDGE